MGGKRTGKGKGKHASLKKDNEELELEGMLFGDVAGDEPAAVPLSPAQRKRMHPTSDRWAEEAGEANSEEDEGSEVDEGDEVRTAT